MNEDFRVTVSRLALSLYQFSYLLIPDRLQAQQVAIDSLARLGVSWGPMRMALLKKNLGGDYRRFQMKAYQSALAIAQSRLGQISQSSVPEESADEGGLKSGWGELTVLERACAFLFFYHHWNKREIAEILNLSQYEVMSLLAGARDVFSENVELEQPHPESELHV